nr:DUF6477 family protein [Methyloligella sp. GL2]
MAKKQARKQERETSRAKRIFGVVTRAGAHDYRRPRDLPKLLPLWPEELEDRSYAGTETIANRLAAALRTERRRALANHWSYDLNRHLALLSAYKAEQAYLARLAEAVRPKPASPEPTEPAGPTPAKTPRPKGRASAPNNRSKG